MTRRPIRRGYTLLELVVVMAILLLLAVLVLPSIAAFRGDTRPRAAVDVVRGELAVARGRAMTENKPYRVAISTTGTRIRRGPDGPDFATVAAFGAADETAAAVDYEFEFVTARPLSVSAAPAVDDWVTIALLLPNGTCFDDNMYVDVQEGTDNPLHIHIRGLTGSSRIVPSVPATAANGSMK